MSARRLAIGVAALSFVLLVAWGVDHFWMTRPAGTPVTGDLPDFTLPDTDGTAVSLSALLEKGPAVVVFYRGHW